MMDLENKLKDYIAGDITLSEFEGWFVPAYWNIHHRRDDDLSQIVYEIELRLAEYSNGDWSEEELKGLLLFIMRDV